MSIILAKSRTVGPLLLKPQATSNLSKLSTSCHRRLKEIVKEEDGNKVKIAGVYKKSPRKERLVEPSSAQPHCDVKSECHPLCRFDQIHNIKHTDVLILDQFVDNSGNLIPREVTGLCKRQHYRLNKLVAMAQKAGLMGTKDRFAEEKITKPWAKFNSYWDEKSIDTQWNRNVERTFSQSFKSPVESKATKANKLRAPFIGPPSSWKF